MFNFSPEDMEKASIGSLATAESGGRMYLLFNPAATGDVMALRFSSIAAVYDMTFHFLRNAAVGIVETRLDGVLLNTTDRYTADPAFDDTLVLEAVAVGAGEHVLTFTVNGKNGASAGFFMYNGWSHIDPR